MNTTTFIKYVSGIDGEIKTHDIETTADKLILEFNKFERDFKPAIVLDIQTYSNNFDAENELLEIFEKLCDDFTTEQLETVCGNEDNSNDD